MEVITHIVSVTHVPNAGVVMVTRTIDLEPLRAKYGKDIPHWVLIEDGVFDIDIERSGKSRRLGQVGSVHDSEVFVRGFRAHAEFRRQLNRRTRKPKRAKVEGS
jgi:hypothetical protein